MRADEYRVFAAAICDADAPVPEGLASPAGTELADRFAVYRNNVHVSLVESLAAGFPATRAHVGEDFFAAMARAHVQEAKPASALLTLHGEDFPGFIAGFAPAASLPWLPDLARLEHAWSQSWAAADAPALPITALRTLRPEDLLQACVRVHPAARLVRSSWPVADLWEARARMRIFPASTGQGRTCCCAGHMPMCCCGAWMRRLPPSSRRSSRATHETAAALSPALDAGSLLQTLFEDGFILEIRS